MYKNLSDVEMMQMLLQKPAHTVGVAAGMACVGIGYNFATAVIEQYKLKKQSDNEERLSNMRIEELKRRTDEECDGFKRRLPRLLRLFYRLDRV